MNYPSALTVGDSAVVELQITLDRPIASLEPSEASIQVFSHEASSKPSSYETYVDRLRLYPIMSAELVGPNFTVARSDSSASASSPRRTLQETGTAAWTWNIIATTPGEREITVNLYGTDTVAEEKPFNLVKSITRSVTVSDKPWNERLQNWFGNNIGLVFGTGGPLGLLLAYLVYRMNRSKGNK